ncbi:MAG: HNH endonuclease [Micrococcales bacterium]|nr:MAG: HNH endonuclease [Micrococcales bacterium]
MSAVIAPDRGEPSAAQASSVSGRRLLCSTERTLVLNAGYEPLSVVSFKRAVVLVLAGKAVVLAAAETPVRSGTIEVQRPRVILLTRYVRVPFARSVPVSRRGVLRRDAHRCAYCGKQANTVDHVLPRSRGGPDSWENLVACCLKCNNAKGNRTPAEVGWKLRVRPKPPRGPAWVLRGADRPHPAWAQFLPDAA